VVRVVDADNYVDTIGIPGNSIVERYLRDAPPQRVVVFDQECKTKLADLQVGQGSHDPDIVISASGSISIPAAGHAPRADADPRVVQRETPPPSCPAS
jgi:hypothetical protein